MPDPYFKSDGLELHLGDCREVLAGLADNSVDAICCDPPYEISFMSRAWDGSGIAFDPVVWRECLRVLKPGGHLVAFGGTRTYHRLAVAIEDAGFEIRDSIHWIFGSGFPKGQDIAKSIDRRREDRTEVLRVTAWLKDQRDAAGWTTAQMDALFGFNGMASHWTAIAGKAATVPTPEQWDRLRDALGFDDTDIRPLVAKLNGRKGALGEAWQQREVVGEAYRVRRPSDVQIAALSEYTRWDQLPSRTRLCTRENRGLLRVPENIAALTVGAHEKCRHKHYRMTCSQLDALIAEAEGRCQVCRLPGVLNAKRMLYIDHDAGRGNWAVRGLLCNTCNTILGKDLEVPRDGTFAAYLENAWFMRMLAERGVALEIPEEPPVGSVVDFGGRQPQRMRVGEGWVRVVRGWPFRAVTWRHLYHAYGPHRLDVVRRGDGKPLEQLMRYANARRY